MPSVSMDLSDDLTLGVRGFTYQDLHRADRLRDLYERFVDEVREADPTLWGEWEGYASAPGAADPVEISRLLVRMSRRVEMFVARLFGVESEVAQLAERTRAQDD